ncbi:hypothetical protein A2Z00_00455 [Candidatus Gottesmanbacteria bacterium RBG_13_45_10]|uniref:Sortase n=1 Tax=Candidatus Gottesmanbacteria bacterium RBG_13_45_10 TaxID=1798370 RepID=A0A1F5ZFW7_9BACT|nr:MAG: hypothetical protein A2Z00_00455 [Candidatus Gottesmanbacteria bacterium RBG_13_45_10]
MTHRIFLTLGVALVLFGMYLTWQRTTPLRLSFRDLPKLSAPSANTPFPVVLTIPTAHITLPIVPATITTGQWQDTKRGVSYLSASAVPGDVGNSIMYGHNWPNLLGNLRLVKPGDRLTVLLSNGQRRGFTVAFLSVVTPDDTRILANSKDARITLYTCTGFLDSKRLVVTAIADDPALSRK